MDNPKTTGSVNTGSPGAPVPKADQVAPAGEAQKTGGAIDNSKAYEELQQRLGKQGEELGEYRQFFQNISPLLDRLDKAPELVQAIIDGKVDKDLAKAVLEGRINVKDANVVQQAHEQVKEALGDKGYKESSPAEIKKLVEDQVGKFRQEFEAKAELKAFENKTNSFIEKTSDFQEYAQEIDEWLDSHDVTDIEVAYYAVKGQLSEKEAKKAADVAAAERAKDVVANAAGGGQTSTAVVDRKNLVDELISGRPNPNSFDFGN